MKTPGVETQKDTEGVVSGAGTQAAWRPGKEFNPHLLKEYIRAMPFSPPSQSVRVPRCDLCQRRQPSTSQSLMKRHGSCLETLSPAGKMKEYTTHYNPAKEMILHRNSSTAGQKDLQRRCLLCLVFASVLEAIWKRAMTYTHNYVAFR